ncbi:MAG TPA: DUF1329 domain-containing protein [Candidatus Margulisiibacteriota bacterium]|nr:DUF1329 domain-containing protein [Candidatus Margulisiibacteriota bacterium]
MRPVVRLLKVIAGGFSLTVLLAAAGYADVQPGDVITKDNVDKAADVLSPGVTWVVKHGMIIKVVAPRKVSMPKRYIEATEKYSPQVKLAPNGLKLENYVAGMPFPKIDPNDPQAAIKIMWNYEYRPFFIDDFREGDFGSYTGNVTYDGPMNIERSLWVGDLRRLYYNGRLYVDPKPELPNPDGVRYKESLHPILAPFDLKGLGFLGIRYIDAAKQDDTWLYLPQLRRVRRLSSAQRSDALFGQDADADSFFGYSGHIAWTEWKLLGVKEMLGVVQAQNWPIKQCPGGGDFAFCDVWEKRPVYVMEGVSKLPQYAFGKRVILIDREAMLPLTTDMYDRAGQLWKVWIDFFSYRKQAPIQNPRFTYEDEMPFYPGGFVIDTQLSHDTFFPHPDPASKDQECLYFNQGPKGTSPVAPQGAEESFFTIAHLIESGH